MKKFMLSICFYVASLPLHSEQFYSQYKQDQFVYENFFKEKKDGVFVDIGAHDGVSISNTKFFEEIGWTGICIEPIPEVFERLKKNRTAICVQGCIADKKGTGEFLRCIGYTEMLSGLYNKYHPLHLERIKKEIGQMGGKREMIDVKLYLLTDLLEQYKIFHVDYLSIDTEGNELDILKTIDFDRFDIDVIGVENNYGDPDIKTFLTGKGYKLVTSLLDEIYKKQYPTVTSQNG